MFLRKNDYDTLFTIKKININYSISRYDYVIHTIINIHTSKIMFVTHSVVP